MPSARFALWVLLASFMAALSLAGSTTVESADPPLICIDPGHGGSEPGAVNAYSLEKDINLDVSLELREQFVSLGYQVAMTRAVDATLSIRERYTFCNSTDADLLLSVHTNSVADQTIDGTITIYFHQDDRVLAAALHEELLDALRTGPGFIDFGLRRDALGMVLKSNMPAAVIEPVMMSHPDEAVALRHAIGSPECSDGCRRLEIANAIVAGVERYLAIPPPDGGGGGGGGAGNVDFCDRHPEHRRCA